jgi:hypothetical protein
MDDDLKAHLEAMESRIMEHIDERTHDAETRLLRAFSDFNVNLGVRMRKIEADVSNVDTASTTRLGNLETKLTEMEIRLLKLEGKG